MTEHKCVKTMWGHDYPCGKAAQYEHEGRWYCRQHHPPTLKSKYQAKNEKWKAENDARVSAISEAANADAERKRKAEAYDRMASWLDERSPDLIIRLDYVRRVLDGKL